MTRVAIIGNSHLAAFKDAQSTLEAAIPGLKFQFFGLPNPVFFHSRKLGGDALRVAVPVDEEPDQMIDPEAPHAIPIDDFDAVLLASHAFYFRYIMAGLARLNLLGYPSRNPDHAFISTACATDMMRVRIRDYAVRLRRFFPQAANVAVLQAPFPSIEAGRFSPEIERLQTNPARDALFEMFQGELARICENQNLCVIPPPEELFDAPFFTKAEYARQRELPDPAQAGLTDYLHMGTRYARAVLADLGLAA